MTFGLHFFFSFLSRRLVVVFACVGFGGLGLGLDLGLEVLSICAEGPVVLMLYM